MADVKRLLDIMARLRAPDGCVWDREQTCETIAPYTIEEAYEVDDAIRGGDRAALCEELGDLLLQVVFHAQMAREEGAFDFGDVVDAICDKLVRRHPNVFQGAPVATAAEQSDAWEAQKAAERRAKASASGARASALDGVPVALPALTRARKLAGRARRAGFRWDERIRVLGKLDEEVAELREAVESGAAPAIEAELGDVLFVAATVGNDYDVDPEGALRGAIARFEARFRRVEELAGGRSLEELGSEQTLGFWNRAKAEQTHADGDGESGQVRPGNADRS